MPTTELLCDAWRDEKHDVWCVRLEDGEIVRHHSLAVLREFLDWNDNRMKHATQ